MKDIFHSILSVSLKKKILICYLFISLFLLSVIYLMYSSLTSMRLSIKEIDDRNKNIETAIMFKTNINGIRAAFLRLAIDTETQVWDNQQAVINRLIDEAKEQLNLLKQTNYKDKVNEIEKSFLPFIHTINNELIPAVKSGRKQHAIEILSTVQNERSRVFISAIDDIIKNMETDNSKEMQDLDLKNRNAIIKSIVFTLVFFIIIVLFSYWFINNYVIKLLNKITESAQMVSKGDLGIRIDIKIDDEFGKLANDVNNIIKTIKEALSDISYKTFVILQDVTTMSFAGQEVCHRIDKDLERTTSVATATEQMSSTSADISRNVHTLADSSERAKNASIEGKDMLIKTTSSIEEVNSQIRDASKKLEELTEYSKKIDNIVVLIKDIADQTNLLALNAAIEAARAGEQGRGFAVVADEVRKLAHRTSNATMEINNILSSINRGTSETTLIMSDAVNKSEGANQLVKTLNESFEEIFEGYQRVTEMVQQIVAGSEEQTATASNIAKNINDIAENAKYSSKDVKEMASSFVNFTANAKAFLKTINRFKDMNIEIGVLKADYVLWLNRVIQLIDQNSAEGLKSDELDARNSRMGKWYYGVGKAQYDNLEPFKSLETKHITFHQLGKELVHAGIRGDREKARQYMNEITSVMKEIFDLLDKIKERKVGEK